MSHHLSTALKEHTHALLYTQWCGTYPFDGTIPGRGSGGARVFSGSEEFNYVQVQGLDKYLGIFVYTVRWVSCVTFLNLSRQFRSSEAPVSFQLKPIHWE